MKVRLSKLFRLLLKQKYGNCLHWIPYALCGILVGTSVFALLFVYSHGNALLETSSPGEQKAMSVASEPGAKLYLADVPAVLATADGMSFSEDGEINAAFYNLIGRPAGKRTRYLSDIYQNQEMVQEVYSPVTGLWVKKLPETQSVPLTIRGNLQSCVYNLFAELGKNGTACVYDYKTGEVLCCMSVPGCDSNAAVEDLPQGSLMNKNLYGLPPGSTMKIVTLMLLAEQTDLESLSFSCSGSVEINGSTFQCHDIHGDVDVMKAIGVSCNAFFAQAVAAHLEPSGVVARLQELGWNVNGSGPATVKVSGIPTTVGTVSIYEHMWDFESLWAMIGETKVLVAPLYMCRMAASFVSQTPAYPRFRMDEDTVLDTTFAPTEQAKKVWMAGFEAYLKDRYDESLTLGKTGLYEHEDGTITSAFLGVHEESETSFFITVEDDSGGEARDHFVRSLIKLLKEERKNEEGTVVSDSRAVDS